MDRGTQCKRSIFLMPTSGFIGYLWDDSFKVGNRHQGIDIFAGTELGKTPIIAVYGGYLTRLPDWRSSVIIRIPEDPLQPDRQIWTYYTHMADADGNSLIDKEYPAGSYELPITAGTQIGYQGNFSGSNGYPVGVHLHFSIIRDDGYGNFLNELKIINTIDPSPYFNLALNAKDNPNDIVICLP
ncbi:MAG: M23 family metallopeptidase [Anaerolineaceae bacterium]|nr:M23 family metallopeptidase [Anaerolineaceae bacterium]